jgi:hypothetical protein
LLTLACVLKAGGIYDRSHVERLRGQVAAHLDCDYEFVCLNDSPFPGWWAKISLFEPGRFKGRVLYLDLDVTVIGSLAEIANFDAPFASIKDWERPTINSSVMAWDAGVADHVYERYDGQEMKGGDQAWVTKHMPEIALFPPEWCVSFKHQCRHRFVPPVGARVIVFHGQPKPWHLSRRHWAYGT